MISFAEPSSSNTFLNGFILGRDSFQHFRSVPVGPEESAAIERGGTSVSNVLDESGLSSGT